MGNKEGILDVTDYTDFDWNGFYEKMEQRHALHVIWGKQWRPEVVMRW